MLITRPQDSIDTSSLLCDDSGGFDYGPDISGLQDDITNIYNDITNIYNDISGLSVGGVSDGDKGDITVSGSGLIWEIDSGAVTYDKIQNLSTDNILLGRGAGEGVGPIQEIVLGTGLLLTGNTLSVTIAGGSGDVTGGSSSVDNSIVRFDGTTGKKIQDSLVIIDDSGNISGVLSILIGGGYGSTGTTIYSNGNISTNGNIIIDGTVGASNLSGTNTGDETASSILTKLLTVDGTGSNLDADFLDGHNSDYFVTANVSITGATNTKITYDSKGLVTAGTSATTADINDSTDRRYVTDADLITLSNTSGVNTGDQDLSIYITGSTPTTDTAIVIYDGTTGRIVKDSIVLIDSTGHMTGATQIDVLGGWSGSGVTIGEPFFGGMGIGTKGGIIMGDLTGDGGLLAFVRNPTGSSSSTIGFYSSDVSSYDLTPRWLISVGVDESGLDYGSNLVFLCADNTGGSIVEVINIPRNPSLAMDISRSVSILGGYGYGGTTIDSNLIGTYIVAIGDSTTPGTLFINKDSTGTSVIVFETASDNRWILACTNDESGGDSGSDLKLNAYDDTGGYETVMFIPRKADEAIVFNRPLHLNGGTA